MTRIILLLALLSGCFQHWTKADTAREIGFIASDSADWYQTRTIVTRGHEVNPIMGQSGQNISPDIYFPLTFIAHALIAGALPPSWRHAFQYMSTGVEIRQVYLNYQSDYSAPLNTGGESSVLITNPPLLPQIK